MSNQFVPTHQVQLTKITSIQRFNELVEEFGVELVKITGDNHNNFKLFASSNSFPSNFCKLLAKEFKVRIEVKRVNQAFLISFPLFC